jgi:hypothetical protein
VTTMASNLSEDTAPDYFISYTGVDEKIAEWIAWQIEKEGHKKVVIMAWDFKEGENFVLKMQEATTQAKKTIVILSPEYLAADYTGPEWATAFACDPTGKKGKLIPILVRPVVEEALGLFKSIIRVDLTGKANKEEIENCILKIINASEDGRKKPIDEPPFPFSIFKSSETSQNQSQKPQYSQSEANSATKKKLEDSPEFKAGLVDKREQASQIFKRTDDHFFINEEKAASPLAFLLYGAATQWPDALTYILYYEIKKQLKFYSPIPLQEDSPDPVCLNGRIFRGDITPEKHLRELIAEKLNCPPIDTSICNILASKKVPNIFYRCLLSEESENPELVRGMLEAWEKLKYSNHSPRHILILYYEHADQSVPIWLRGFKKTQSLIEKINKTLPAQIREKQLLPEIKSPNKKLIEDWIDGNFSHSVTQEVKDYVAAEIRQEYEKRKKNKIGGKEQLERIQITKDDFEIHHHDLKNILIKALMQFDQQNI